MKHTGTIVALMAAASLMAGCASQQPRIPDASAGAIEAHRSFLASDALAGRATGTPGYDAAAEYVAAQFALAGVEPAGTDGYMQQVPYASATLDTESVSMRLIRDGETHTFEFRDDFVAGPDPAEPHTHVRAGMVFVGYGIRAPESGHDDYAGVDAHGRVVVMLSGTPGGFSANERAYYGSGRVKNEFAVLAGAVGVVTLRSASSAQRFDWERISRNAGTRPSLRWVAEDGTVAGHFPQLRGGVMVSEDTAASLFEGAQLDHEAVMAADEAGEPVPAFALMGEVEIERRSTIERTMGPNVVAVLRGADPALADEYVVYTAHLDHLGTGREVDGDDIYNGAYDNAMGTAILLETARMFASLPEPPRRSILFVAVGAEERGLLGSDYYANYPSVDGRMVANVNLDMPLFLYPVRDLVGYGAELTTLGGIAARAAADEGFEMSPDPMPEQVIFTRSDHYSFARAGVPAIFMMTGHGSVDPGVDGGEAWQTFLGTHYHRPSDDLDLPVHWPSVRRFARVNLRIGLEAANADAPPAWLPGNIFTRRFAR